MGRNSKIGWTHTWLADGTVVPGHTFNPWMGCTKVSQGCKFCYAEAMMDTRFGKAKWGPQGKRVRTSAAAWREPLTLNDNARETGVRARVFCASLADLFEDNDQLLDWRRDALALIDQCRALDWLLLTKRPQHVLEMISNATGERAAEWLLARPHIWIGTSVEDQANAEERIPALLRIPTWRRFLSVEPMLGPVDLSRWLTWRPYHLRGLWADSFNQGIHWAIVGGESPQGEHAARPLDLAWVRQVRDACVGANVPFFFKQRMEGRVKIELPELDGKVWKQSPDSAVPATGTWINVFRDATSGGAAAELSLDAPVAV